MSGIASIDLASSDVSESPAGVFGIVSRVPEKYFLITDTAPVLAHGQL